MDFIPINFSKLDTKKIFSEYGSIMSNERKIRPVIHMGNIIMKPKNLEKLKAPAEIFAIAERVYRNAGLNFVPRSYNGSYGLSKTEITFESVGAHTNLVCAIAEEALDFFYGHGFGYTERTIDGYLYQDVITAIHAHDLAELRYGDLADNGSHDKDAKFKLELEYLENYLDTYSISLRHEKAVLLKLLKEMEAQSSHTGKVVYLADKAAALIATLYLDSIKRSPMIRMSSSYASDRDKSEMRNCDRSYDGAYKASEMWAVDYFVERKIVDIDESLFFTALIVMMTLIVNGRWYNWREKFYQEQK